MIGRGRAAPEVGHEVGQRIRLEGARESGVCPTCPSYLATLPELIFHSKTARNSNKVGQVGHWMKGNEEPRQSLPHLLETGRAQVGQVGQQKPRREVT